MTLGEGRSPTMIPKLEEVVTLLDKIAPVRLAEPWDNPGLQVGSYSQEIKKILLALDPTLKSLRSASTRHAQLLLTHHPLIFEPLSRLDINTFPGNVIIEAAKNEISIVAVHTNLDVSQGGINDILADLLDLHHVEALKEMDEGDGFGLGRIGNLPEPLNLSVLTQNVKRILGKEKLRVVGQKGLKIHRLAVVGGSGGNLLSLAFKKGADLLITGDVSHHHALEAQAMGIALIDGGHFHTERLPFRIFAERLNDAVRAQGWEVAIEVEEDETDPMRDD
jgi:dinuclear metal center YbgI/SA1388 family protein